MYVCNPGRRQTDVCMMTSQPHFPSSRKNKTSSPNTTHEKLKIMTQTLPAWQGKLGWKWGNIHKTSIPKIDILFHVRKKSMMMSAFRTDHESAHHIDNKETTVQKIILWGERKSYKVQSSIIFIHYRIKHLCTRIQKCTFHLTLICLK